MKNSTFKYRALILLVIIVSLSALSCVDKPAEPFTVILLPDTQNYSEMYPETYLNQTEWITENIGEENIRFVIHLGDMVQHFDAVDEWKLADRAHQVFEKAEPPVPFSVVPGNHDLVHIGEVTTWKTGLFDEYFGPGRFEGRDWYGGGIDGSNSSNYCFFEGAGVRFMVLSLNFAPGEEVINWADSVIERYKDMPIILVTHAHLNTKGRLNIPMPYGLDGYVGVRLWENFIRRHENINLVLCGHVGGAYRMQSENDFGKPVNEILFDYQSEVNGGNGWLVKMQFIPQENRIQFTTYSPKLNRVWDSPKNTYNMDFDFPGR